MFRIELHNMHTADSIVDSATAETEEEAAREAIAMIRKAGALSGGDRIMIHEVDEG